MLRRLLALAFVLSAVPAAAQERITSFDSQLHVRKDGTLDVVETIDEVSDGTNIRHGIYRDFPTRYRSRSGGSVKIRFDLQGTERDGSSEPNRLESRSNGVRIKIGSADNDVEPGPHEYKIRYSVTREIGRFKDYDELYWNVTGSGWMFPIDRASATILLPSPARFGQRAAYTGAQGSASSLAEVTDEGPGRISFATTAPLSPYEGLTIAAAFPKGVVDPPSAGSRLADFLGDFLPPLIGALGALGTILFVFFAWNRVGRDPRAGTVVPLFTPPEGMSPAAIRYVEQMGFDNRAFAASLVDLGVRGHLKISEEKSGLFSGTKKFIERTSSPDPLDPTEFEALDELIGPSGVVEMDDKNHERFSAANDVLDEALKKRFDGKMFNRNLEWAGVGIVIMIVSMGLAALAFAIFEGFASRPLALLSAGAMVAGALVLLVAKRSASSGKCLFGGIGVLLCAVGVLTAAPLVIGAMGSGAAVPVLLPLLGLPAVLLGFRLMSAPTAEGRAMLDRIAGFKQYLSITEGERLDRMTAPAETLETFERYLPYAIALGVENRWANRFAAQIAAASAAQQAQTFGWYSGSHRPWDDIGGFTRDISSGLSSSISSASTAPGSSSGSGGGGFSGGGGGGGGGGGW